MKLQQLPSVVQSKVLVRHSLRRIQYNFYDRMAWGTKIDDRKTKLLTGAKNLEHLKLLFIQNHFF